MATAVLLREDDGDPTRARASSGRLAAFLFAVTSLYLLATEHYLATDQRLRVVLCAAVTALTAAVVLVVPWPRLPRWTSLLPALWALGVLAGLVGVYAGALSSYLLLYTTLFLYVGLTQQPWTSLRLTPPALLSLVPALLEPSRQPVPFLLGPVLVAVLLGEVTAQLTAHARRGQEGLATLVEASTRLQSAAAAREASDVIAGLACDLLGAEHAMIMLRTTGEEHLLVNSNVLRGALPPGALTIDLSSDQSLAGRCLSDGVPLFSADAAHDPGVHRESVRRLGVASALFLPLGADGAYEGVAVVLWKQRRRHLDRTAARTAQVLATQAGQVLARAREAQVLHDLATTDALTGLANRRAFFTDLTQLAAGDCVVFLDLDHFKRLNDTLGHPAGDAVLRAFAGCLRQVQRESDRTARYGGEEFAMLLPNTSVPGAVALLDRLRGTWAQLRPEVTFSAGIAPHQNLQPAETLAAADAALYAAKAAGRNTTRTAEPAGPVPPRSPAFTCRTG